MMNRQFRRLGLHLIGAFTGGVAAILFAAASFRNFHCWTDWLSALKSMPDQIITVGLGNFSAIQIFNESFHTNASIPLALIFCGLAAVLLRGRRRDTEEFPEAFAVSVGCLLVVVVAPLAWLHYYVLTIPALLFLLRPAGAVLRQPLAVIALAGLAAVPIVYLGIPLPPQAQGALAVCSALLLLVALAISSLSRKITPLETATG